MGNLHEPQRLPEREQSGLETKVGDDIAQPRRDEQNANPNAPKPSWPSRELSHISPRELGVRDEKPMAPPPEPDNPQACPRERGTRRKNLPDDRWWEQANPEQPHRDAIDESRDVQHQACCMPAGHIR